MQYPPTVSLESGPAIWIKYTILLFTLPYLQNLKHKLPFNFISTYHILGAVVKTVVMPSARKCVCCHELEKVNNVRTESRCKLYRKPPWIPTSVS